MLKICLKRQTYNFLGCSLDSKLASLIEVNAYPVYKIWKDICESFFWMHPYTVIRPVLSLDLKYNCSDNDANTVSGEF